MKSERLKLLGKYVKVKEDGRIGLVDDVNWDVVRVMYPNCTYGHYNIDGVELIHQGIIDYGDEEKVPCCLEFKEEYGRNSIILHIPKRRDTTNIIHSVTVKGDLFESIPLPEEVEEKLEEQMKGFM